MRRSSTDSSDIYAARSADGLGIEGLAVVEDHAAPQLELSDQLVEQLPRLGDHQDQRQTQLPRRHGPGVYHMAGRARPACAVGI